MNQCHNMTSSLGSVRIVHRYDFLIKIEMITDNPLAEDCYKLTSNQALAISQAVISNIDVNNIGETQEQHRLNVHVGNHITVLQSDPDPFHYKL